MVGMHEDKADEAEFASWRSYWAYAKEVRRGCRYVWSREVEAFLNGVRHTAEKRAFRIKKDYPFFRAQVGWQQEVEELEDGTLVGPLAFSPARMKPAADRATSGRANAAGIAVLYVALDPETAIAEARPWIGSQVSVSRFRTTRELQALNLTEEYGKHWMPTFSATEKRFLPVDADAKEKAVWTDIDNAFSRPVSRTDDSTEYVPTQILAELFRDAGYEAVTYRSLLGERGYNVVIFDPADAHPVDGTPYQVKKITVAAEVAGNAWVRSENSPKDAEATDGDRKIRSRSEELSPDAADCGNSDWGL